MFRFSYLALIALLFLAACSAKNSGIVPTSIATTRQSVVLVPFLTGYDAPVYLTNAHDGSNRLFVVEQGGRIQIVDSDGTKHVKPFLDISAFVLHEGERGLLSMAFHPHYTQNGWFFVDYTDHQGAITATFTKKEEPDDSPHG